MSKNKLNKGSAGQNRKASEEFIQKYQSKKDVYTTGSGLLYRVLEQGSGITPTMNDSVEVNQRILLFNGKVIADTYQTGNPDRFSLQEAITGVQEGLLLSQEGGRYEFVVPAHLAWGRKGVGDKIGPESALIFDLRLLSVLFN